MILDAGLVIFNLFTEKFCQSKLEIFGINNWYMLTYNNLWYKRLLDSDKKLFYEENK